MSLTHLTGARYGPHPIRLGDESVSGYVVATGDDPTRWRDHAPPSYAGALLFAIAPTFLSDPVVEHHTRVLIHADQEFTWSGPLRLGTAGVVAAEVRNVRERGGMSFVSFSATVRLDDAVEVTSISTFLMGAEAPPDVDERAEPRWDAVATDAVRFSADAGAPEDGVVRTASRADLVRYAAASGDFNPIHWDHRAAVDAGLDGIVVHGLLMHAWLCQEVVRASDRVDPLERTKLRFRTALHPAEPAVVRASTVEGDPTERRLTITGPDGDVIVGTASLRTS